MAIQQNTLNAIKARFAALNCELLEYDSDDEKRFYVLDRTAGKLVSVCSSLSDQIEWLDAEESGRADDDQESEVDEIDREDKASVLALLNYMIPLRGCTVDETDEYHLGRNVVSRLATVAGPVSLTLDDCANALNYLHSVEPGPQDGGIFWDDRGKRDGGNIGCGLNVILESIERRIRSAIEPGESDAAVIARKLLEFERHFEPMPTKEIIETINTHEWTVQRGPTGGYRAWLSGYWTEYPGLAHLAALLELASFCREERDRLAND